MINLGVCLSGTCNQVSAWGAPYSVGVEKTQIVIRWGSGQGLLPVGSIILPAIRYLASLH